MPEQHKMIGVSTLAKRQDPVERLEDLCCTWKRSRGITRIKVELHPSHPQKRPANTNLVKQSVMSAGSSTRSSPRKVAGSRRSATGKSLRTLFPF